MICKRIYLVLISVLTVAFFWTCKREAVDHVMNSHKEYLLNINDSLLIGDSQGIYEKLFKSVEINDLESFDELLEKITNVDSLIMLDGNSDESYSILGYCCKFNSYSSVKKVIDFGADIHVAYSDEIYVYDALYLAVQSENSSIAKLLIDAGADVTRMYNEEGYTSLEMSCQQGNYGISSMLLSAGANINGLGYTEGTDYVFYPLLNAIASANVTLVDMLITKGANLDTVDRQGETPLIAALRNGSSEMLGIILCALGIDSSLPSGWDGLYEVYAETDYTTTGASSIHYKFSFLSDKCSLATTTVHNPIRCNGEYLPVKKGDDVIELYYLGDNSEPYCIGLKFTIKKDSDKYYILGVGGERTNSEWQNLSRITN